MVDVANIRKVRSRGKPKTGDMTLIRSISASEGSNPSAVEKLILITEWRLQGTMSRRVGGWGRVGDGG